MASSHETNLHELEECAKSEASVINTGLMAARLVAAVRHWDLFTTDQRARVIEIAEAVELDVLLSRLLR